MLRFVLLVEVYMYIYWLFWVKFGGPYPKKEENSFFVFEPSGYFWQAIRAHKCAKFLKIIAFLKFSDMYIYVKCLKSGGVVIAKEKKFLFEVFSTSGYFWHSIRMHKYAKYLKIIPFLKSSDMYIYV